MISRSLQFFVIFRIVVATIIFAVVLTGVLYIQLDQTLLILRNRTIADEARDIASYMEETDEGSLFLDLPEEDRQFYAEAQKLHQYVVRDEDGEVIFTSPVAYTDMFPDVKPDNGKESFFEFTGEKGTGFLGGSLVHENNGTEYLVQIAQSEQSAEVFPNLLLKDFLYRLALFGPPFVLMLIAVIYWSIRQSMKPIRKASKQAGAISFKRMDVRLSEKNMPSEILPLIHAVNGALFRLESGVQAQREFTANAAHELRTPLSILRSHVDSLEDGETVQRLRQDIDAMTRLTTQLLDMSRLDFPEALPMEKTRLDMITSDVCRDLWPLFIKQEKELKTQGLDHAVEIYGNRDAVYRAVRNLLENALVHSPAKTPVEVTLDNRQITIRDHGPAIDKDKRERIFERFHRGDSSVSSGGAGLGLAIVKRTMALHGGSAHVEPLDTGNAFILEFPAISGEMTEKI